MPQLRTFIILPALAAIILCGASGCLSSHRAIDPKPVGVDRYVEGAMAYEAGDTDKAIVYLTQAVKENPNLTMARVLLGDIYRSRNDYHSAAEQYEEAARLDPYSYESHYHLGLAYQFLNRLREAAAAYLKALNLQPRDVESNMNLGTVYLALGQTDDAVKQLKRAVEINPKSGAAWTNLGIALETQGDYPGAESAYRKALELDSLQIATLIDLSGNLIHQGRGAEAAEVARAAIKMEDSAAIRKRYGDALLLTDHVEDALEQYGLALKKDPKYYQVMNQIGFIMIKRYQQGAELDDSLRDQALKLWKQSLEIRPDQPQVKDWINRWMTDPLLKKP